MESALPYRIPGPAGGFSTQPQSQSSFPEKPVFDLFRIPPWRQMLAHLNRRIPSSVALLRRNALSGEFVKLNTLPVLIDSLVYVGKDASVVLRDPTGLVRGTIHSEVFKERKGVLERGVVMLLDHVSALEYVEESRGFRAGEDVVHLSVQACHVSAVFQGDSTASLKPPSREVLDDYEPQARAPKPIVKPPSARIPLRERNDPRAVSQTIRPTSRGAGIAGGRPRHWHPHQQSRPYSQQGRHQQHSSPPNQNYQRQPHPNYTAYPPNVPHPRTAPGSRNHKRPFRPPSIKSNAAGVGIPPPQKRPHMSGMYQAQAQPREQARTVSAITDDQLDSLLGDLDVDAVIAAHTKLKPQSEQIVSSTAPERASVTANPIDAQPISGDGQQGRSKVVDPDGKTFEANPSATKKSNSRHSTEANDATVRSGITAAAIGDKRTSVAVNSELQMSERVANKTTQPEDPSERGQANNQIISNLDQDVFNNLFEGIDTTDFK